MCMHSEEAVFTLGALRRATNSLIKVRIKVRIVTEVHQAIPSGILVSGPAKLDKGGRVWPLYHYLSYK